LLNTYNSRVLVYAGEWDAQDGPATQEAWIRRISLGSQEAYDAFWNTGKALYYVKEDATKNTYDWTGGYMRQGETLSYLTIPHAGHFVPNPDNYYEAAFEMF
jgi:hypothetical protein